MVFSSIFVFNQYSSKSSQLPDNIILTTREEASMDAEKQEESQDTSGRMISNPSFQVEIAQGEVVCA